VTIHIEPCDSECVDKCIEGCLLPEQKNGMLTNGLHPIKTLKK